MRKQLFTQENVKTMNNREIKLALTVGLMNTDAGNNIICFMKDLMLGFNGVGSFIGLRKVKRSKLNTSHVKQTYAIQFENCILDVDLVSNHRTKNQFVQSFQLR